MTIESLIHKLPTCSNTLLILSQKHSEKSIFRKENFMKFVLAIFFHFCYYTNVVLVQKKESIILMIVRRCEDG